MRFIPLTSSVLECGWQMPLIGFLLSLFPSRAIFKLFHLWLERRSANGLLLSVLGSEKIAFTRWLQTLV